ncbi:MAG: GYF domain-containing protein [Kofleriaceae bacterium]
MKIVCDACQAKYSISDDKVQGKVFKIRCKKCSNIIVVRGGAGAVEQAAAPAQEKETRVYDYGYEGQGPSADEAVWHVVINQDQVGPMTAAEVEKRFVAGEVDADTYAWREGFADWMPLSQVDAFASFASANAATTVSSGSGAAAASIFGSEGLGSSGSSDLFGSSSASSSAMAASGDDDGGDLFGSKPAASRGGAASAAAAEAKLRGERNENSVLFSLNNLAQLASDKPAPSAAVTSMPSGHATGAAGGEGSGLIDIRSMANAYLGNSGASSAPRTAAAVGTIDDLPVFGGGGFTEPAVLVPTAARSSNNKMMFALIASVGVLAIAAVVMVIVLLKDDKPPAKVAAVTPPGEKDSDSKADAPSTPDSPGSPGSAAEPSKTGSAETPPAADNTPPVADKTPPASDSGSRTADKSDRDKPTRDKPHRDPTPSRSGGTPAKADPPPAKEPAAAGGCDEVSCVLNNYEGACCAKFRKGGSKTASASSSSKGDLPDKLDRGMIQGAVDKVKARVMSCGDRSSAKGMVKVSVKVSPEGRVSSASPTQTPDPSLGNCVASAMSKASFPKTQTGGSFSYPFTF